MSKKVFVYLTNLYNFDSWKIYRICILWFRGWTTLNSTEIILNSLIILNAVKMYWREDPEWKVSQLRVQLLLICFRSTERGSIAWAATVPTRQRDKASNDTSRCRQLKSLPWRMYAHFLMVLSSWMAFEPYLVNILCGVLKSSDVLEISCTGWSV